MAPSKLGNSDKISVYAEFITSLSVANIFVGFLSAPGRLRVRKVTVEPQNINISLTKTGSDNGSDCPEPALILSVPLPNYVSVLPNTCSSLQPSPYGWQLRMNIEEIADNCIAETKKPQGPFAPQCGACKSSILGSDAVIGTVSPLSSLGLPPDMDWDHMGFTYFCHDHGHHDDDHQDLQEDQHAKEALFVPRPSEVFVCDTAYIVNAEALDFSKLTASADNSIACGRCHSVVGQNSPKSGAVKLYFDAILSSAADNTEKMLGTFVKNCSREYRRIRASLQDSNTTLLLWIMDHNLKTFQACVSEKSQRFKQQEVCKILYKHEELDSPLSMQWAGDSAVKQITIHESLLAKLLSALLCSTENLPVAWRHANHFCVGYLNI